MRYELVYAYSYTLYYDDVSIILYYTRLVCIILCIILEYAYIICILLYESIVLLCHNMHTSRVVVVPRRSTTTSYYIVCILCIVWTPPYPLYYRHVLCIE